MKTLTVNRCTIEIPESKRQPWIVNAPHGEQFEVEGSHNLSDAWSKAEAIALAEQTDRCPCPPDCDCHHEED